MDWGKSIERNVERGRGLLDKGCLEIGYFGLLLNGVGLGFEKITSYSLKR